MALLLRYQAETTIPVEVEGLLPHAMRELPLSEIETFPIYHGNRPLPLAELFAVSGDPSDSRLVFEGDLAGVHWIGAGMTEGEILLEGHAGRHVGSGMTGGYIEVKGNAGDWVGGELHGGCIHVLGHAGNWIGAAYRGSRRGMNGGTILIGGSAGDEVGHTMRRGLIAVGGSIGDAAGYNMIAGTIFVFGEAGTRAGAGMRRGTVGLFGPNPPKLLPTFHHACRFQPQFVRIYTKELTRLGFVFDHSIINASLIRYCGDLVALGKGEILLRQW